MIKKVRFINSTVITPVMKQIIKEYQKPDQKKIIYADDNIIPAMANKKYIQSNIDGVTVDIVGNGNDLVEKVKNGKYVLIVTDNNMPYLTGLEAIQEIRKFDKEIPIIMISGDISGNISSDVSSIKDKALKAGANDYLKKPFERRELTSAIQRLYKGAWKNRTKLPRN